MLIGQPHLVASIFVGSTIASLSIAALTWLGVFGTGHTTHHILLATTTMLFVAPIYGSVIGLPIVIPLLWLAV